MLKTLRKKLMALATCLTGAVVLSVCLISFLLIRNQYLENCRLAVTSVGLPGRRTGEPWSL